MKKLLLSLLILATGFKSNSQTIVSPEFRLGDPSQTHVLTTYRGDRLVGNVIAWEADSLTLSIMGAEVMKVKLNSLESIWVKDIDAPPYSHFSNHNRGFFYISTDNGTEHYSGRLKIFDSRQIKFHPDGKGLQYFKLDDVDHLKFVPNPLGHPNTFEMRLEGKKGETVQFISYENGIITIREQGQLKTYGEEDKLKLFFIKSSSKMRKNQRQLFMSPTGFNLKGKEYLYQNTLFIHNELVVGLLDNFSVSAGGLGILPYFGARISISPHRLLHLSMGGMVLAPIVDSQGGGAWHLAISFGTSNHFINIARIKYLGAIYSDENDFQATSLGGSMRLSNRLNFFAEFNLIDQEPFYFLDTIEGRINAFSSGLKWFGKTTSITLGVLAIGPRPNFCRDCPDEITKPYPGFAATIYL